MSVSTGGVSVSSASSASTTITPPPDRSGWLYKRGNYNSSWKKRWFVLRYQTLKYFKSPKDSKAKGFISLSQATVEAGTTEKMKQLFGFEIHPSKSNRVFVIHAENENEMKEWMNALQQNIDYVARVIEENKLKEARSQNIHSLVDGLNQVNLNANATQANAFNERDRDRDREDASFNLEVDDEFYKKMGIPLRNTAWRKELQAIGFQSKKNSSLDDHLDDDDDEKEKKKEISSSSLRKAARLPFIGAATIHNVSNMVAVGSYAPFNDLDKGMIQLINIESRENISQLTNHSRFADLCDDYIEHDAEREQTALTNSNHTGSSGSSTSTANTNGGMTLNTACSGEINDISWYDDLLACASDAGVVALYKLPSANLTSAASSFNNLEPIHTYVHSRIQSVPIAAPGKYALSSRIRQAKINPITKREILTVANTQFFVWDIDNYQSPVHAEVVSEKSHSCLTYT